MRIIKNAVMGLIILVTFSLYYKYVNFGANNLVPKIVIILFLGLFFFSILARKIAWFQPYFTSKYNIFTSKFRNEKVYDFPKDILFHKTLEVLNHSKFRVLNYDENKGVIFATSPMTWLSWGENIYVNFKESDNDVTLNFCSASLFGIYSWGKNEENYKTLVNNFNESLII